MHVLRLMICVALVSCASAALGDTAEVKEQYFTIKRPEGFDIQKVAAVESDYFYTISLNDKPYVRVYVGNAPRFPRIAEASDQNLSVLRTRDVQFVSKWADNQIVDLEVLIARAAGLDWPQFVQAWTVAEAPDKQTAYRILLSLTIDGVGVRE